jgi:hypothetical protein
LVENYEGGESSSSRHGAKSESDSTSKEGKSSDSDE